jgi:hypothetical protein
MFRSEAIMQALRKKALRPRRHQLKLRGIARRRAKARALLRDQFGPGRRRGPKSLLAAAPLEGIDLTRDRNLGRDIDL